jgi:hypothetical protein
MKKFRPIDCIRVSRQDAGLFKLALLGKEENEEESGGSRLLFQKVSGKMNNKFHINMA